MNEFFSVKKVLLNNLDVLNQIKKKVVRSLKKAPEGKLILSSSNGSTQYYWKTNSNQKKGKYLDKKNKKTIIALAQKDYEEKLLKEIEKRIKRFERMLEWIPCRGLEEVYENLSSEKRKFVLPYVIPDAQYIEQWSNVNYTGKRFDKDSIVFFTEKGEKVRSKSEKIIADKLLAMGIPYRYEYPIELPGYGTLYPDFMLLNVTTRKEVFLEHLGMMDNPEYCEKAISKIHNYARYGMFPGKNLLLTFETRYRPLNTVYLEELLNEFLAH